MPASWGDLAPAQQNERLIKAEDRRVARGTTFALDGPVAAAVRTVARDTELRLPVTADVLPAPSGMLVSKAPLCSMSGGPMVAVTWGPPMEGFGPGVHLTWWAPMPAGSPAPLAMDHDLHLPYLPLLDARLWEREADLPSDQRNFQVPLRAVVASWYALSGAGTDLAEHRPAPALGRALAGHKAQRPGVLVATAASPAVVRDAIADRAAAATSRVSAPLDAFDDTSPPALSYGVFAPERDAQLDPGHRPIAHAYREAAGYWNRMETEVLQAYPGVFDQLEQLRVREHGTWPSWCWMPSGRVAAYLKHLHGIPTKAAAWDGPRIAALGAWRSSGRTTVMPTSDVLPHAPVDAPPAELPQQMPVMGLGLVIPDGSRAPHLVLACGDWTDPAAGKAEIVLLTDGGERVPSFRYMTRSTLFPVGDTLTDAVKFTQDHYDRAAVLNGETPAPTTVLECQLQAASLGHYTGRLAAACRPGARLLDAGWVTGLKESAAPWPPEPSGRSEMQMWVLTQEEAPA
ncbi:hypothetical protein ACIBK8_32840 [Streptomyces sp. NPDC050161]|uniref:hypothetical protein n=1 Tax=Streptomyces sp. NPDC050161 TaxID=3365604 RepID=UPI00379BBD3E